jgi:hypothetical protein
VTNPPKGGDYSCIFRHYVLSESTWFIAASATDRFSFLLFNAASQPSTFQQLNLHASRYNLRATVHRSNETSSVFIPVVRLHEYQPRGRSARTPGRRGWQCPKDTRSTVSHPKRRTSKGSTGTNIIHKAVSLITSNYSNSTANRCFKRLASCSRLANTSNPGETVRHHRPPPPGGQLYGGLLTEDRLLQHGHRDQN